MPKSAYESEARLVMLMGGYMSVYEQLGMPGWGWVVQVGGPLKSNGICIERLYGTIGRRNRRISPSAPTAAMAPEVRWSFIPTSAGYSSTDRPESVGDMNWSGLLRYLRVVL